MGDCFRAIFDIDFCGLLSVVKRVIQSSMEIRACGLRATSTATTDKLTSFNSRRIPDILLLHRADIASRSRPTLLFWNPEARQAPSWLKRCGASPLVSSSGQGPVKNILEDDLARLVKSTIELGWVMALTGINKTTTTS